MLTGRMSGFSVLVSVCLIQTGRGPAVLSSLYPGLSQEAERPNLNLIAHLRAEPRLCLSGELSWLSRMSSLLGDKPEKQMYMLVCNF
jgi:hypothetical protein